MYLWEWIFEIKTKERIAVFTEDDNQPSKTKAIIELAKARIGCEGRSEETLKKIGYDLKPILLSLKKINSCQTAFQSALLENDSLFRR